MKCLQKQILSSLALTLLVGTYGHAAAISGQGTWETTLLGRDLDGNAATYEAYYDTVQNITWLADANYAKTTGHDWSGEIHWYEAMDWVSGLDIGGVTGWRLPTIVDVGNDGSTVTNLYQGVDYGYNITTHSELSHMFYETLGNTAEYDTSGNETGCGSASPSYCLANTGPFSNLQSGEYWSGNVVRPGNASVWYFSTNNGLQGTDDGYEYGWGYAWAVRDGDVSAVPIPAAVWLFGSGLIGLIGWSKRKQH